MRQPIPCECARWVWNPAAKLLDRRFVDSAGRNHHPACESRPKRVSLRKLTPEEIACRVKFATRCEALAEERKANGSDWNAVYLAEQDRIFRMRTLLAHKLEKYPDAVRLLALFDDEGVVRSIRRDARGDRLPQLLDILQDAIDAGIFFPGQKQEVQLLKRDQHLDLMAPAERKSG